MNDQDIRVIKTKESIEKAFLELLGSKPLGKVTVVELARMARIHKSTFYLHYLDIPDLYTKIMQKTLITPLAEADFFPCLFDDPERMLNTMRSGLLPLLAMFRDRIYDMGRIERSAENDIKLDSIFGSLLICVPNYDGCREEVNVVAATMIRALFPPRSC